MDFNGFQAADFDFFKKKEKMLKDEYEKGRNDVKLHFRGLCYEMQKIHHKKTGGVLTLEKDFQNFNKRSNNIYADHGVDGSKFKILILMNSDHLKIETEVVSNNDVDAQYVLYIIKDRKSIIWELTMSSKFTIIYAEILGKDKKNNYMKLSSLDINTKNNESFINFIENSISKGKTAFKLGIGYVYPKSECLKQGKSIAATSYDAMNNLMDNLKKIV
jgi:hypothetical protein